MTDPNYVQMLIRPESATQHICLPDIPAQQISPVYFF